MLSHIVDHRVAVLISITFRLAKRHDVGLQLHHGTIESTVLKKEEQKESNQEHTGEHMLGDGILRRTVLESLNRFLLPVTSIANLEQVLTSFPCLLLANAINSAIPVHPLN